MIVVSRLRQNCVIESLLKFTTSFSLLSAYFKYSFVYQESMPFRMAKIIHQPKVFGTD